MDIQQLGYSSALPPSQATWRKERKKEKKKKRKKEEENVISFIEHLVQILSKNK